MKIKLIFLLFLIFNDCDTRNITLTKVQNSLEKGIEFYRSLAVNGGYAHYYSKDLQFIIGEEPMQDSSVEVQFPGTPAIGNTYLYAYHVTGNKKYLGYAVDAAYCLIDGMNKYNGWDHVINFKDINENAVISLDDDHTQGCIRFLIEVDKYYDSEKLTDAVERSLNVLLNIQQYEGGWPHFYPHQGNFHDYATFNDGGINNCIRTLTKAYRYYKDPVYLQCIIKAGDYILKIKGKSPNDGWGMQYDKNNNPAWARTFEPPSLTPVVSLRNLNTLMNIYKLTGDKKYLEPIEAVLAWVKNSRLPNGSYPRFIDLHTGEPLYYDRGRKRVSSVEELSDERRYNYAYEQRLDAMIKQVEERYENLENESGETSELREYWEERFNIDDEDLKDEAARIISYQDDQGRWLLSGERLRRLSRYENWLGDNLNDEFISGGVFIYNISLLCRFIEFYKN
ncbi:MAG: pectate lyase [Ignavibacteria bacterium]|jgi:PelA/Pel-15E family pectate lyase